MKTLHKKACEECGRTIPIAPGYYKVGVPHVRERAVITETGVEPLGVVVCDGDEKRQYRDALAHPSEILARQHDVLDDDRFWDSLE